MLKASLTFEYRPAELTARQALRVDVALTVKSQSEHQGNGDPRKLTAAVRGHLHERPKTHKLCSSGNQCKQPSTFGVLNAQQTAEHAGNRTGQLALRLDF
jgi:hypothetical protein